MSNKILPVLILGILLVGTFSLINLNKESSINYNCNDPDIIFLKSSEKEFAGEVAKEIRGIAIIPEENYLVGDTEFLKECDNINFKKYLKGGDYF